MRVVGCGPRPTGVLFSSPCCLGAREVDLVPTGVGCRSWPTVNQKAPPTNGRDATGCRQGLERVAAEADPDVGVFSESHAMNWRDGRNAIEANANYVVEVESWLRLRRLGGTRVTLARIWCHGRGPKLRRSPRLGHVGDHANDLVRRVRAKSDHQAREHDTESKAIARQRCAGRGEQVEAHEAGGGEAKKSPDQQ